MTVTCTDLFCGTGGSSLGAQSGAGIHPGRPPFAARPWLDAAECLGVDAATFFPERGDHQGVATALAICAGCPVRDECLDTHIDERDGIWGGTSARERKTLRQQHREAAR